MNHDPVSSRHSTYESCRQLHRVSLRLLLLLCSVLVPTLSFAQWVQTNGPSGGVVQNVCVSGTNMFAATGGAGVFLSTDAGANWKSVNTGLPSLYMDAIFASGSTLYVSAWPSTISAGGVFVSANNGTSWTPSGTGLLSNQVNTFASIGGKIFAGTSGGGVYISANSGASWSAVNTGLSGSALTVHSLTVDGTTLISGTSGGVFRSTNDG